ncbi:MAG: hypothetical protein RLZZ383_1778 [Pseudomonadota bacterium]|jgi:hypothetical protein
MRVPAPSIACFIAALAACGGGAEPTAAPAAAPGATGIQPEICGPLDGPDTDGDGLSDTREATLGTNPEVADSDADGKHDGKEVCQMKTDPTKRDTDGDGLADGAEVARGLDPLVADPGVAPPKPAPQVGGAGPDGVPLPEGAQTGGEAPAPTPTEQAPAPPAEAVAPPTQP